MNSTAFIFRIVVILVLLASCQIPFAAKAAVACQWDFFGTLALTPELQGLKNKYGDEVKLEGVTVRIAGRKKVAGIWGNYLPWGDVKTDANGYFRLKIKKACGERKFRVRIRFQESNLEVRHKRATSSTTKVKWHDIYTDVTRSKIRWNFGTLKFQQGKKGPLGEFEPRRHGQIWTVYRDAMKWLNAQGKHHRFKGKVKVKYPHNGITGDAAEASYVNPTTKVIYIVKNSKKDQFDTKTLLHELGHKWAYDHSNGEFCLTTELLLTGNTHGTVDSSCVAFHEGFAEYFADEMLRVLQYRGPRIRPNSRSYMKSGGYWGVPVTNLDRMQRTDEGWRTFFHILDQRAVDIFTFNAGYDPRTTSSRKKTRPIQIAKPKRATCRLTPELLKFSEILRVFSNPAGSSGHMSKSETTIPRFLSRARRVFPRISNEQIRTYRALADPSSSVEPWERMKC